MMLRRFFANAALIAGAELIVRAKGLILVPLLSRNLGPEGYGTWAQVVIVSALFGPLILLSTDLAALRFIPGKPEDHQKRQFSAWLIFLLAMGTIVGGALLIARDQVAIVLLGKSDQFSSLIVLATIGMIAAVLANSARAWFRARNDAVIWAAANVGLAGLNVVAAIAVFMRGEGVYQLLLYTMTGDVLVGLWLFILIFLRHGFAPPDWTTIPQFLRFGLPLLPAAYAMACLNMMDRLFLVHYATLEAIGVYSVVYSAGYLIIQVVTNPIWAMYPTVAADHYNRGEVEQVIMLSQYSIGIILALVIPAVVGLSSARATAACAFRNACIC